VVTRRQLLEVGLTAHAIEHRLARGRPHHVATGVYSVGRPELSQDGRWMAAVLSCGPGAALSHHSAAVLWRIRKLALRAIDVTVSHSRRSARPGVTVHRRRSFGEPDVTTRRGIPVTTPICTLIDLATTRLSDSDLEAAVNEADKLDLVDPESLRAALADHPKRPGGPRLRRLLDRRTFTLTDSELERAFLPIARRAGLPKPQTQQLVNGYRVDFFWPELGLVVETDGLRYHRTPAQQARDALRDQTHTAAHLTPLRFTHAQVRYESDYVEATLTAVAARLSATLNFMGQRTDIFDLGRLNLHSGEGRRIETDVSVEPIDLSGQAYSVEGGVAHVVVDASHTTTGYALRLRSRVALSGPCVRCLEDAERAVDIDVREVDQPGGGDELRSPYVNGDELDLRAWTRDAVIFAMPGQILCTGECRGLCPVCGENLNAAGADHRHEEATDPRWAKLGELRFE
jgi:DUF177 domain-containing protein